MGALNDAERLIRGAAAWALGQLGTPTAVAAMQARLMVEDDETVRQEIDDALRRC